MLFVTFSNIKVNFGISEALKLCHSLLSHIFLQLDLKRVISVSQEFANQSCHYAVFSPPTQIDFKYYKTYQRSIRDIIPFGLDQSISLSLMILISRSDSSLILSASRRIFLWNFLAFKMDSSP